MNKKKVKIINSAMKINQMIKRMNEFELYVE